MSDLSIAELLQPISPEQHRAQVFAFERTMLFAPQVELEVEHHFGHNVVAREMRAPAGVIISGRIHLFENLNMLLQGEMILATESGPVHLKAPCTIVSPPGTKRIAQTLTPCVWTTIIGTSERDPEKIEEMFTTNDEQQYLAMSKNLTLEGE